MWASLAGAAVLVTVARDKTDVYYCRMTKTYIDSKTGAVVAYDNDLVSRSYCNPVLKQPQPKRVTECRNCGAPKHGAVCEYCKT